MKSESLDWSLGFGQELECSFEEDSNSGHVLLLDCTLRLVLRGFSHSTVLASRAASSMSCHHATLSHKKSYSRSWSRSLILGLKSESESGFFRARVGSPGPKFSNPGVGVPHKR